MPADVLEVKLSLDADLMRRIEERLIPDATVEKVYAAIERELTSAPDVYTVNQATLRSAAVEALGAVVSDLIKVELA